VNIACEQLTAVATPASPSGAVHRMVRNSALNLIGQGCLAVFYLVVVFILARSLGKDGLGTYYLFFALILAVQWVAEAGLSTVLTCRIAQRPAAWRGIVAEAAGLCLVVTLVSAGVFLVFGGGYAWLTGDAELAFCCAAAGVACAGIQLNRFCGGVFRAFERVGYENWARFIQGGLFVLLVVLVAVAGWITVGMVLAMFAASHVIASGYLLASLAQQYPLGLRLNLRIMKDWLTEAVPLGFGDMVRHLTWQLDTLLLGLMTPAAVVGIYSVAYRPLGPLNWLPHAVLSAMFPAFARMADGDRAALGRAFAHSLRLMWLVSLPLVVTICLCAEPLIIILAGREYLEAARPMRVLIWIAVLSFLSFPFRFLFTAVGRQKLFAWLATSVLLLELVIEAALIPHFGYMGACAGSIIGEVCFTVVGLVLCARLGIGRLDAGPMARGAAAALAMAGIVWLAPTDSWLLLGAAVAVGSAVYFALCLLLGALRWEEVVCFRQALRGFPPPAAPGPCVPAAPIPEPAAGAPATLHIGLIQEARVWMNELRAEVGDVPPLLTIADLRAVLGDAVTSCELWRANWRNRVYIVRLHGGRTMVAKQMCVPSNVPVEREYEQLQTLARLQVPGLRVPGLVALLPQCRVYVMEFIPGRTVHALFWQRSGWADLPQACALAGDMLGRLQQEWTAHVTTVPVQELADDLAAMPGGYSARQWRTVRQALDAVADQQVAIGLLYRDFKTDNILVHGDGLALIDPPLEFRRGILLWDYATFRSSLCWQLWKRQITRPASRQHQLVRACLAGFDAAYARHVAVPAQLSPGFPLLLRLLELQQVGQLLVFQAGKLRLACQRRNPLAQSGQYLRELCASLLWLPAMQLRKQCLIGQIRRLLLRPGEPALWPAGPPAPGAVGQVSEAVNC